MPGNKTLSTEFGSFSPLILMTYLVVVFSVLNENPGGHTGGDWLRGEGRGGSQKGKGGNELHLEKEKRNKKRRMPVRKKKKKYRAQGHRRRQDLVEPILDHRLRSFSSGFRF